MTSRRNVEDEILDAARACVEAFGVRRTTLTDVARRAGVSRPTVYRRWPDADSLVADLLTREMVALLGGAAREQGGRSAREHLVEQVDSVLRAALAHPLFAKIVDNEPETLATYAFQRLGTSQFAVLDLIRPQIEAGQADGSVRAGSPETLARIVLLTAQNLATSRRLAEDLLDTDGLAAEVRALLHGYLAPGGAAEDAAGEAR
ncbi:TetR/AcrR family transcriptional regulator [Nocardiopsis composta]|uniref:AcrR family transcriptional regulator n=1 Tax=Nocardiopsis composta TaxID=157465 RepID=A0A7W8QLV5_9ACTN|nr:TetR/AcrR family transcriptional regulator [Nocardiopsis composta]MBB5432736.1 AcrR family transcriptional regulator [Nocardiopsis composta]